MLFLAGYFPKLVKPRDPWLKAPAVTEVWSVSSCMASGREDFTSSWRHNDRGLYDTVALAESVIPSGERGAFRIVGYRLWDRMFADGAEVDLPFEASGPAGPEPEFETIGFDAVSWEHNQFAHSPLSCNGGAQTIPTNELCLFRSFDEAIAGARTFSTGSWEPGPYCVVEVLRRAAG